jgi:tripartite-type tricarboxylate transporter receptor subunit TctC
MRSPVARCGWLVAAALLLAACAGTARAPRAAPADGTATVPAAGAVATIATAAGDEPAVATFYRGKTIRLLVGTAAGGSYDVIARVVARHLGKQVPGNPAVIVENMPGANNLVAANYLYRVGPKDGTLIQSFVGSLVVRQAFGAPGVEYDASRLHYLGAPATDAYVLAVTRKSGITRVEETFGAAGKPLVLGTLGPGSPLEVGPSILRDYFGANIRLVSGYDGGAKIRLAIDGGEVDGTFISWQELRGTSREKLDSGEWVVLRQASTEPLPEIPSVPAFIDLARDDEQRQLIRLATTVPYAFARPYVVAPEVPAERVRALAAAFARTMADAEFRAEAERGQLLIEPLSADAVEKLVREFLSMPPDLREKLQPIMWPL